MASPDDCAMKYLNVNSNGRSFQNGIMTETGTERSLMTFTLCGLRTNYNFQTNAAPSL